MKKYITILLLLSVLLLGGATFSPYASVDVYPHIEEYIELQQYKAMQNEYLTKIPIEYKVFFQSFPFSFDPLYLAALVEVESNWRADAVSPVNYNGSRDYGIAQLNSRYVNYFGKKYGVVNIDPFNAEQALFIAASHLQYLYERTGNIDDAIVAYNIGLSAFRCGQRMQSGLEYLEKVNAAKEKL